MHRFGKKIAALMLCAAMAFSFMGVAFAEDAHVHAHEENSPIAVVGPRSAVLASSNDTQYPCSGNAGGSHLWKNEPVEGHSKCPGATGYQLVCSYCGETRGITEGNHSWGAWREYQEHTDGDVCTDTTYREHTCVNSGCGETEREVVTAGRKSHSFVTKTEPSTCTTAGRSWEECSVCGEKRNETALPLKSHTAAPDDGDCTTPIKCADCGAVVKEGAAAHRFAQKWSTDGNSHWHACTNPGCQAKADEGAHTGGASVDCTRSASCTVCGAAGKATGMRHDFSGAGGYLIQSNSTHAIRCANPGCKIVSDSIAHTAANTPASCTEATVCVCGYTIKSKGNHVYSSWVGTATGHSRTCTRCGDTQSASHTGSSKPTTCTTAISCTTCGYVINPGYSDHAYGVWIATPTGHTRTCTHAGCSTVQVAAHSGGTATCAAPAACTVCGASYGAKAAGNHAGGTEVRNAKTAQVGVAGYTGDTYCLGCGKMIAGGKAIPALTAAHSHSYSAAWEGDSSKHWHACACGAHAQEAAHSFENGACTLCGVKDPNYVEVHIHAYGAWKNDGQAHWHECSGCGEQADYAAHVMLNGKCAVCGIQQVTVAQIADVANDNQHYEDIKRIVEAGVMGGATEDGFKPDENVSRAAVADAIYRLADSAGQTAVANAGAQAGAVDTVAWAQANGLMDAKKGDTVTFQEVVTTLYRCAQKAGYKVGTATGAPGTDAAWKGVEAWASRTGIIKTAEEAKALAADAVVTRAQMAALTARFMDYTQSKAALALCGKVNYCRTMNRNMSMQLRRETAC